MTRHGITACICVVGELARALRERGRRVIPICPLVTSYIRRHPEYADLVAPDPAEPE